MSSIAIPATFYTATDFHETVVNLEPKIAVFDCDGTLWGGDAGSSFMRYTLAGETTALLSPEKTAWLQERYEGYKRGEVNELAICGEMVQVYAGLDIATLRQAAATFFHEHVEPHIFPEMLTLVHELERRGCQIWAVSSTCDWVIEEGVRRFGIPADRVLAACVECVDGLATGELRDVPTDEGKVLSLRRAGILTPDVVFGNSVHDAAMLAIARHAFPVNPTPALEKRSLAENWRMFYPAAVERRY